MTIWFTSDLHIGHENIIRFCGRPFTDTDQMSTAIVINWNSHVEDTDDVYVLGDFAFKSSREHAKIVFDRLKGQKHLIVGNHDNLKEIGNFGWKSIHDYYELKYNHKKIILCHYPLESWNGMYHGTWHVHGHVHSTPTNLKTRPMKNRYDIGVDNNNFTPVSYERLKNIFDDQNELEKN